MDVQVVTQEVLEAFTSVSGSEPTDEELARLVVAVVTPIVSAISSLDRIAAALERLAYKADGRLT